MNSRTDSQNDDARGYDFEDSRGYVFDDSGGYDFDDPRVSENAPSGVSVSTHQLHKELKKELKKDLKQKFTDSISGKEDLPPVCETGGGLPSEDLSICKEWSDREFFRQTLR